MDTNDYGAWPDTKQELDDYIAQQFARLQPGTPIETGYELCPDIACNIAVAAFNFASGQLGLTGFQAGWAEMQFLRITRGLEGPFAIIDGTHLLYPQYDIRATVDGYLREWPAQLVDKARELLAEDEAREMELRASPKVAQRWREIVAHATPPPAAPGREEGQ